jgi:hypothetical protein
MHDWKELVQKNKIHLIAQNSGSYPIMHFTGLLDRNGVEIYEDDIIEVTYMDDDAKSIMQVVFEKAQFYLKGNGFWALSSGAVTLLVIGNVHQNPELLNHG